MNPIAWMRHKWGGTSLSAVHGRGGGWYPIVRESYAGAWQQNREISVNDVMRYGTVWSCISLVSRDISKLWLNLVEKDANGIWTEIENSAYSPVLRNPNHYQNHIQFIESWVISKLTRGNTYVLKERDGRGVVQRLYILDPARVTPLVAPDRSVFYQLGDDPLSGLREADVVPAREIIHDRCFPIYHPLVGVSPIHAAGAAAMKGLRIEEGAEKFFSNQSQPGGLLIAPGPISTENAKLLEQYWEANFTGVNAGRVAVLSDGMEYKQMGVTAHDAQLVDQLKMSNETIASAFHVPLWKLGLAPLPPYGNVQAANVEYYSVALQQPIELIEALLDEGLNTGTKLGTEFDMAALLRMDTLTQMEFATKGVQGSVLKVDEARSYFDLKPVDGGDTIWRQQQDFSISALAERDRNKPFSKAPIAAPAAAAVSMTDDEDKNFDFADFAAELDLQSKEAGLIAYV